jgi:hypothetical protein
MPAAADVSVRLAGSARGFRTTSLLTLHWSRIRTVGSRRWRIRALTHDAVFCGGPSDSEPPFAEGDRQFQQRVRCEPISPADGAERQAAFGINELLTTVGQDRSLLAPSLVLRSGRLQNFWSLMAIASMFAPSILISLVIVLIGLSCYWQSDVILKGRAKSGSRLQ